MNVDRRGVSRRRSTTRDRSRRVSTVSIVIVCASQPSVLWTGSGAITQLTVTFVMYQPFAPCVPKIIGVTVPKVGLGVSTRTRGQQKDDYAQGREKKSEQAVPGTLRALASPQV